MNPSRQVELLHADDDGGPYWFETLKEVRRQLDFFQQLREIKRDVLEITARTMSA